ncbi:hemolysin family protein [Bacillaceae bacterium]
MEIAWNLFLVLFLVFLNGFFVAAEFAMVKIRETRIKQLLDAGHPRAKFAQTVTRNLNAYLSATQLGITLASLGLGWVGEPAVAGMIEPLLTMFGVPSAVVHTSAFIIAFSLITVLHIVLGEVTPKSLAIQRAEATVLFTSRPLIFFYKIFSPAIWLLNKIADWLLWRLGIELTEENQSVHTEEEIRLLMNQSYRRGLINTTEMVLFDKIFAFSDRVAREVMVPRIDMKTLDRNEPFERLFRKAQEEEHTRYPITDGDKDHIVGFIHIEDLYRLAMSDEEKNIDSITRSVLRVSEQTEISDVLRLMQRNKVHIAIVVDEFGGTAGLVTIEDILEELVGEIQDEFDDERPAIEKKGGKYSIDGGLLIEEVNDYFDIDIEAEEDYIGGWVYTQLHKVPELGDTVVYDGVSFTVEELDEIRITRLLVERRSGKGRRPEVPGNEKERREETAASGEPS